MSARGYVFNKFDSEDYDDITPTSPIMLKTDIFGSLVVTGKVHSKRSLLSCFIYRIF